MDQTQALAVVRSLANGVDPETGEVFPPESAYQRPQTVRALYEAAAALERQERFRSQILSAGKRVARRLVLPHTHRCVERRWNEWIRHKHWRSCARWRTASIRKRAKCSRRRAPTSGRRRCVRCTRLRPRSSARSASDRKFFRLVNASHDASFFLIRIVA